MEGGGGGGGWKGGRGEREKGEEQGRGVSSMKSRVEQKAVLRRAENQCCVWCMCTNSAAMRAPVIISTRHVLTCRLSYLLQRRGDEREERRRDWEEEGEMGIERRRGEKGKGSLRCVLWERVKGGVREGGREGKISDRKRGQS